MRFESLRPDSGLSLTDKRIVAAMDGSSESAPTTVREIGDALAKDGQGQPLKARTIQEHLTSLQGQGVLDGESDGKGTTGRWWLL
ncbi:MAG TPA: hypothetical protein VKA30_02245 [Actinomycetota bacterium]|nr:hypothetical protein [Actinomycetota bacterium]